MTPHYAMIPSYLSWEPRTNSGKPTIEECGKERKANPVTQYLFLISPLLSESAFRFISTRPRRILCCVDSEEVTPTDRIQMQDDRKASSKLNRETPTRNGALSEMSQTFNCSGQTS